LKETPLVSIGIPTFNRMDMLISAIESVERQTYSNIELVISDNASTDGTADLLAALESRFTLKILCQENNIGMRANWNACLNVATGQYFLLLSDDDLLNSRAIQLLVDACRRSQNLGFCYGRVGYLGSSLGFDFNAPSVELGKEWLAGYVDGKRVTYPSAALLPAAIARDSGGYPDVGNTTDFALLLKLSNGRQITFVNEIVCGYRVHSDALSNDIGMIDSLVVLLHWLNSEDWVSDKIKRKMAKNYHWYIAKWIYQRRLAGQIEKSDAAYSQLIMLQPRLLIKAFVVFKNNRLFLGILKLLIRARSMVKNGS
jgi:glycosyltransferase involved in cell wall biosynthesis